MKKLGIRVAASLCFLAAALFLNSREGLFLLPLLCYVAAYLIIGHDILRKAFRGMGKGQLFDENFLMALATFGAFVVGEYPEAVAVMLFYQVGEGFNAYAVNRSRGSIQALMELNPETACILRDGS